MESEIFCGGRGDVERAAFDEGAPVIDAKGHGFSVSQIGDADLAGEGESFVRGRFCPRVLFFADRGFAGEYVEEAFVVVGGDALFDIADGRTGFDRVVGLPANRVGLVFIAFVRRAAGCEKQRGDKRDGSFHWADYAGAGAGRPPDGSSGLIGAGGSAAESEGGGGSGGGATSIFGGLRSSPNSMISRT